MDKKTGTPEGGRDERALVETVAERIKALVAMAETVKNDPADLLEDVWESEDYRRLSDGAKAELRAKAGVAATGEKTESATKVADIDIGNDSRTSWIAEQASALVKLYASSGETPDLSVIWNGEDFEKLPEDVQRAAKAWVAEKYGIAAEEPSEASEPPSAEAPPAQEAPEGERGRRPKRREFVGYRLEREDDGFTVTEDYDEWDATAEKYVRRTTKTTIVPPPDVAKKIAANAAEAERFVRTIDGLRKDIDTRGVKMFFDRPKDDAEKIFPKWKWFVGGKKFDPAVPLEEIPEEIIALVKADPQYHKKPEWTKWFGKKMQKKREDVIAENAARQFRPAETAATAPAEAAPTEAETPPTPYPPEVVRAGARRQVELFARIFRPESAEDHVRYVIDSVRGTLEHPLGGGKRPPVDRDFLWTAVREELFARFGGEGDEASLEAVKRVMPKEDAVRRYVAAHVNEALGPKAKDEPPEAREGVTAYLSAKILGGGTSPDAAEKIRAGLASYDERTGTLTVPDPERLRGAIVNLHRHLAKGGEGGSEKKDA